MPAVTRYDVPLEEMRPVKHMCDVDTKPVSNTLTLTHLPIIARTECLYGEAWSAGFTALMAAEYGASGCAGRGMSSSCGRGAAGPVLAEEEPERFTARKHLRHSPPSGTPNTA